MKKSLLLGRGDTSFAISLALHLAFIGFFWVSRSLTPSFEDAPEGVFRKGNPTWIEVGSFQEQAFEKAKKPKVVPVKTLDPDAITLPAEKRAEKEERIERKTDVPAETTFGYAEGTATEGELGVEGGRKASLRERYIYELRLLLEGRKVYPNLSRSMRETGRVWIAFSIDREGKIDNIALKESSGFKRLDTAAVGLVQGVARYRPLPDEIAGEALQVQLPVEYVLQ